MKSIVSVSFEIVKWVLIALINLTEFCLLHSTQIVWGLVCCFGCWWLLNKVFKIKVTIHPATVDTFESMVRMFQRESMFCEANIPTTSVGIDEDADLTCQIESKDIKLVKSNRRVSYAVRVAHIAKAQVGLLDNTKANELVYSRLCRDEMVKHGVRPSHIAHMVPLAVAACFIPLDSDFLAASLRRSDLMKERRSLLGSPIYK
jgi:hypothetical protein